MNFVPTVAVGKISRGTFIVVISLECVIIARGASDMIDPKVFHGRIPATRNSRKPPWAIVSSGIPRSALRMRPKTKK